MLKEYLVVAQEALKAKKEMYLVKQQRLELAKQEMLLFSELSEDNHSVSSSKPTHQFKCSNTSTHLPPSCHSKYPGASAGRTPPQMTTSSKSAPLSCVPALSGSSSNSKYDPGQIKAEIACRRERVSHRRPGTMRGPSGLRGAQVPTGYCGFELVCPKGDEDEIIIKGQVHRLQRLRSVAAAMAPSNPQLS